METMETTEKDPKKYRQRKKQRYNVIRQQMEFYFGDSNLTKDRYLHQLIKDSSDGFVSLEEFLKFNKIKNLTENVQDIRKSVSGSELLELSTDGTKVKRKTEINLKPDVDECTLYVESLPKSATHDYVKEIFTRYGPVSYVSLPRYRNSKRIKEFGFIEFEDKSCVEKALAAFKEFGGVLEFEAAKPEELQSVVSFNEEQKMAEKGEEATEMTGETESEALTETEDTDNEQPPKKKLKVEENQENTNPEESGSVENPEVKPTVDETLEKAEEVEKSKKSKKKRNSNTKTTGITDNKIVDLRILPKTEWKRLRNKYLNMQRERFKEIKQQLNAGRKQQEKKQNKKKPTLAPPVKATTMKTSPRKINFYGALPDRKSGSDDNIDEPPSAKKPLFSFEPGLIVNIKFREPLLDIKKLKAELRQLQYVKYVDVKEGDIEAFVRVDKCASANQLVKYYVTSEYQTQILSGEVEQLYWNKILADREQKLNKKVKVKQVRGREKIQKKAATHIHFD